VSLFPELDEPSAAFPPPLICVLDTSVLIDLKRLVKTADQWNLLLHMTDLVDGGHLAFPSQVVTEMTRAKFPDAPGVWVAGGVKARVRYPQPTDATLVAVLAVAELLVEADDDDPAGVADPYVAAMDYELGAGYPQSRIVVATSDCVDRLPRKISLATACDRLSIEHWQANTFIAWARDAPDVPAPELLEPPE
jgi:hypothetical protein